MDRAKIRRRLKQGAAFTAGGAVLVGSFLGFLHTSAGGEWLRSKAEARLDARVSEGGSAKIGGLSFSLATGVRVSKISLRDKAGVEVAAVDEAWVDPSLRQLVRGKIDLTEVQVKGVKLRLVQLEGGGTNLAKIFAKKPDPSAPPTPPSKPLSYLRVGHLGLQGGDIELKRLDGSLLTVTGVFADASLVASPAGRDVDASVSKLGASLTLRRPDGQEVTLRDLTTGVGAKLVGGSGEVKLLPLAASLGLVAADGRRVEPSPIALGGLAVGLSKEQITAGLQQIEVLALAVGSVDAQVGLSEGEPTGAGHGSLGGVRLDKDRLNALLGKPLLASHVDLSARVDGSKEQPSLGLTLSTEGGQLTAALKLDASKLQKPKFNVEIASEGLKVHRAVQLPDGAEATLGPLKITAQGDGTSREDVASDFTLSLGKSSARGVDIEQVRAEGRFEKGVVTLRSLTVEAAGQRAEGQGSYTPATRSIDASLRLFPRLDALAEILQKAGRKPPSAALVRGLRLGEGVPLQVQGSLEETVQITVPKARVGVAGGAVEIDGKARLRKGKPEAGEGRMAFDEGGGSIKLSGVRIPALLSMLGRPDRGLAGRIDGVVDLQGTRAAPSAKYDLNVSVERGPAVVQVHAHGKASREAVALSLEATKAGDGKLLQAEIKAPLAFVGKRPRVDPGRPLSVRLDVPSRALASLADLLPPGALKGPLAQATAAASLELDGPLKALKGKLSVDAEGPFSPKLGGKQRVHADVALAPGEGEAVGLVADVSGWLHEGGEPQVKAHAALSLPRSPLVAPPDDVKGQLTAEVQGVGPVGAPPVGARLSLNVGDDATTLAVRVLGQGQELATVNAEVGLGGRGIFPKIREKSLKPLGLPFSVVLDIPERELASLAPWAPKLAKAPGRLSGKITAHGPATSPGLDGQIGVTGLPASDGTRSQVKLSLSGSPMQIAARLSALPAAGEGVTVEARVSPLMLAAAREVGGPFPVDVSVAASGAKLSTLAPPSAVASAVEGLVDSDLRGRVDVALIDGKPKAQKVTLQGGLSLRDGVVKIPGSTRTLRDLGLQLKGDGDTLTLVRLGARESDLEQKDRSVEATGSVTLKGVGLDRAALDLKAHKWLVFGGNFGPADAPRASLDADASVAVAFSPEGRRVKATVRSLELLSPDRFLRAHQQEVASLGDVIEVQSPAEVGKLPRPAAPAAAEAAPAPAPAAGEAAAEASAEASPERGTEIEVELPPSAHIKQMPLDLRLSGRVRLKIAGGKRSAEGALAVSGGSIFIGGRHHQVAGGELRFDEANPGGYFDIVFQRSPHPAALRDVATGGGDAVRVHLEGPYGKQKPAYEGLGVGSLFDTLAINNAGRPRYASQPDMPASEAAQLPLYMQLRQITFMAVNLPHLLFLDRISVWADPYDDRRGYGRLTRHEAESYSADGSRRLRTVTRPARGPGQSEAEVSYDLLFQNTPRVVSGVGLKAGSRAGGGPGVFWEWSSEDLHSATGAPRGPAPGRGRGARGG